MRQGTDSDSVSAERGGLVDTVETDAAAHLDVGRERLPPGSLPRPARLFPSGGFERYPVDAEGEDPFARLGERPVGEEGRTRVAADALKKHTR